MTDATAPDRHEFRPSWPAFHRRMLVRLVWLAPLLLLTLLIAAWPSLGTAFVALGAALVIAGIGFLLYFGRARVTIEAGELRIRGALRSRRWPLHAIGTVVLLPLPGTRESTLYGVSPVLERMFSLSAQTWEQETLEQLAEAVGAPVVHAPAGLAVIDIKERYPGTIGWTTTHPWALMLLVVGGAMAVTVVVSLVVAAVLLATGQVPLPTPNG
ncbi:MAG: hypothetical protein J0H23_10755 [Micrococcales bacterium]|mgnify:CR=1 FL=1|nr:hypothetical protein [Micrococcales bacterium]OJX69543.1 MAG: hypothetical protein BGO94_13665 [Micrococcales bacterium 72-143]